jgi:hypothetical protein
MHQEYIRNQFIISHYEIKETMKFLPAILALFISISSISQDTLSIYYPVDQHHLSKENGEKLASISGSDILALYAHTDIDATAHYNIDLSKRRLHGVIDFYKSNGIDLSKMPQEALGETQRKYLDKSKNRRVDIIYNKVKAETQSITAEAISIKKNLFAQLKSTDPCQHRYCIDPNKDTLLIGKRGTVVKFQAGSFKNVQGCVDITITEPSTFGDMILYDLTTQTRNGDILISDGMIKVEAKYNDAVIQPVKPVIILKPTKKIDPEMKLFIGGSNEQDAVVWEDPNGKLKMLGNISDEDLHALFGPDGLSNGELCGGEDYSPPRCRFLFCKVKKAFQSKEKKRAAVALEARTKALFDSLTNWCGDRAEYLKEVEENFNPLDEADLSKIPADQVNYYVFQANQLGWMNLDKFGKFSGKRVDFRIKLDAEHPVSTNLAFMKYNSMLRGIISDGYAVFQNVPVGYTVKVIAFEYSTPPKMGVGITKTSKKEYSDLKLEEHSLEEMQSLLQSL